MTEKTPASSDQHYRAKATGKWASLSWAFFVVMLVAGCADGEMSAESVGDAPSSPTANAEPTPNPIVTSSPMPTPDPTPFRSPPARYVFADYRIKSPMVFCVNPAGGPPLENPLLLVAQVAVANWQMAGGGNLPLRVDAECPGVSVREIDGLRVIGWGPMFGSAVWVAAPVTDGRGGVVEGGIILDPADPGRQTRNAFSRFCSTSSVTISGWGTRPRGPASCSLAGCARPVCSHKTKRPCATCILDSVV